jgi:myosin heavy subunit
VFPYYGFTEAFRRFFPSTFFWSSPPLEKLAGLAFKTQPNSFLLEVRLPPTHFLPTRHLRAAAVVSASNLTFFRLFHSLIMPAGKGQSQKKRPLRKSKRVRKPSKKAEVALSTSSSGRKRRKTTVSVASSEESYSDGSESTTSSQTISGSQGESDGGSGESLSKDATDRIEELMANANEFLKGEIRSLKGQADKMCNRIEKMEDKVGKVRNDVELKTAKYQARAGLRHQKTTTNLSNEKAEHKATKEALKNSRKRVKELEEKLKKSEQQLVDDAKDLENKLEKAKDEAEKAAKRTQNKLDKKIKELERDLKKASDENEDKAKKIETHINKIALQKTQLDDARNLRKTEQKCKDAVIKDLNATIAAMKKENKDLLTTLTNNFKVSNTQRGAQAAQNSYDELAAIRETITIHCHPDYRWVLRPEHKSNLDYWAQCIKNQSHRDVSRPSVHWTFVSKHSKESRTHNKSRAEQYATPSPSHLEATSPGFFNQQRHSSPHPPPQPPHPRFSSSQWPQNGQRSAPLPFPQHQPNPPYQPLNRPNVPNYFHPPRTPPQLARQPHFCSPSPRSAAPGWEGSSFWPPQPPLRQHGNAQGRNSGGGRSRPRRVGPTLNYCASPGRQRRRS